MQTLLNTTGYYFYNKPFATILTAFKFCKLLLAVTFLIVYIRQSYLMALFLNSAVDIINFIIKMWDIFIKECTSFWYNFEYN